MNYRKEVGRDISSAHQEDVVFQKHPVMEGNCHKRALVMTYFEQSCIKMGYKSLSKLLPIWTAVLPLSGHS